MIQAILLALGALLLGAKIFGYIAERVRVPSLTGEIFAGILVGPILGVAIPMDFFIGFVTFGLLVILFLAGTEVSYEDIKLNTYGASIVAFAGGLLSFLLGYFAGLIYFNDVNAALAVGIVIASTSDAGLLAMLARSGKLKTPEGKFVITATIADDVIGIVLVSLFSFSSKSTGVQPFDIFRLLLVALGFYLFTLTFGAKVVERVLKFVGRFRDDNILLAVPIAIAFLIGYFTENLGLSMATGAFLAGMAMSKNQFTRPVIVPKVNVMAESLIIPLFYAAIGTFLVLSGINIFAVIAIFIVAVAGKFIGCGLTSMLFGYDKKKAVFVGASLIPRGNENLAYLQIIFLLGIVSLTAYSSIIVAVVLTAVLAPLFMKFAERQ